MDRLFHAVQQNPSIQKLIAGSTGSPDSMFNLLANTNILSSCIGASRAKF
jgi:hypothetical protein